jgi:hypothetical protein
MPINYSVQAQVVDLRTDTPKPTDCFYVDTCVWFWTAYARVGLVSKPPKPYQTTDYPNFLKSALTVGADLRWSGVSFAELAYRIEKAEFEIHCQTVSGPRPGLKEYRHNLPAERARLMQEIETAWQAVETMGKALDQPVVIDSAAAVNGLKRLKTNAMDSYDAFALNTLLSIGLNQVLTDDGDFCVVPGITLFTANRTVLAAAQAQGKLIVR